MERLLQVWTAEKTALVCQCGTGLTIQIGHYEPEGEQVATLEVIVRCPSCFRQELRRFSLTLENFSAKMRWKPAQ